MWTLRFLNKCDEKSHSIDISDRIYSGWCRWGALIFLTAPFLVHEFLNLVLKILMLLPMLLTYTQLTEISAWKSFLLTNFYLFDFFLLAFKLIWLINFYCMLYLFNLTLYVLTFNNFVSWTRWLRISKFADNHKNVRWLFNPINHV